MWHRANWTHVVVKVELPEVPEKGPELVVGELLVLKRCVLLLVQPLREDEGRGDGPLAIEQLGCLDVRIGIIVSQFYDTHTFQDGNHREITTECSIMENLHNVHS